MAAIDTTTNDRGDLPTSSSSSEAAAEYPCVRRLRHRRLLTFLSLQTFDPALRSAAGETEAFFFSVPRLCRLVERGQWKGAVEYLLRFLPPGGLRVLGFEAQVLRRFLVAHMALANILAGTKEGDVLAEQYGIKYRDHGSSVCHGIVRLRSIMLTALHAKLQLRDSLDWECVRRKASEIVEDLAYRTPELKDAVLKLKLGGPIMEPHNVIPIWFSSRHRRHPHKKPTRCTRASDIAKGYLHRKRSLLPSSRSQESHDELLNKAMNCVADAVDESLKAGKRLQPNQNHPPKPSGREGATVAPVPQTTFGTFSSATKITGVPVMGNAVTNADKLSRHGLSSGASFSKMMFGYPVLPTASGSLTAPANNYGISLLTDAGATVTPVSQAIFGTMPGPVRSPGIPSVANSGKFASHVPSPAVSVLSVLGCLTNPDKSSGVSLMTDAGTNTYSSQEGFSAESDHQGIITMKNKREDLSTDEEDLPPKLQRTTGAFNGASLAEYMLNADICD
ncbi:unnamed protein product [Urochloa humidicola]